jgi:hypothetical protein
MTRRRLPGGDEMTEIYTESEIKALVQLVNAFASARSVDDSARILGMMEFIVYKGGEELAGVEAEATR